MKIALIGFGIEVFGLALAFILTKVSIDIGIWGALIPLVVFGTGVIIKVYGLFTWDPLKLVSDSLTPLEN